MDDTGLCPEQGVTVDCDRAPDHAAAHYDKAKGIYWWRDPSPPADVGWWQENAGAPVAERKQAALEHPGWG